MINWRKHVLKTSVTIEDRLWAMVGDSAEELAKVAKDEKMNGEAKKQVVINYYNAIREAFKQLGVIR